MYVMAVQTASTVTLKIPESSPETAEENFKVPAGGQHPGAGSYSVYSCSAVQMEVMHVQSMPSSPLGMRTACLVDQPFPDWTSSDWEGPAPQ